MWKGRFSEDMDSRVLRFTQSLDIDWRMASSDIRGSIAHAKMLSKVGLIAPEEAQAIERGLLEIEEEIKAGKIQPKESLEDVHMNIESILTERIGDAGARLHTARSRNDQVATTVRLTMRSEMLSIWDGLRDLLEVISRKAEEHADIIIPGYTHLQQAQPISAGHWWMAHWTAFARDADRLRNAYEQTNISPLGSGALAGTTLPIDRDFTARELGFSSVSPNSMDSVASRDYMLDYHYFASSFGLHTSRMCEDIVIYFSSEFGWLKLPDAFCTGSSIMPQKKNPDVAEILRGKAGQLTGALIDLMMMTKGAPMTYDRDFQEDKRGLWHSMDTVKGMLEVMPALLARTDIDCDRATAGFADGFIFATDVADYLVLKGIPFRKAHEIVGHAVRKCVDENRALTSLSGAEWREFSDVIGDDLPDMLTPEISASKRSVKGGAAPSQVREQVRAAREKIDELDAFFTQMVREYPRA